jgi:Arc/MetJ-type ribon-helix-helix transcriptional regulator
VGYTKTGHYDRIVERHIRSGRASNKTETIHQALTLLDAVTRGAGPQGATFTGADDLEALLLAGMSSGAPTGMTPRRKARIYGSLKR